MTSSLKKVYVNNTEKLTVAQQPTDFSDVHYHSNLYGVYSNVDVSLNKVLMTSIGSYEVRQTQSGAIRTINTIDPINALTNVQILYKDHIINEQYTCNIHVADEDGADLAGALIACTTFGNVVSNDAGSTFYKCIVGHTSGVFADDLAAGKWELTTAAYAALAGCTGAAANGAWITGIAYVASASEFSVATDSGGDITEQTIDYKKWIGTSAALLTYSPHTFTFTYGGDTHVAEDFAVDHPKKGLIAPACREKRREGYKQSD